MKYQLSASVIFDTLRAHAALRSFKAASDPGAGLDIFLSPDHEGLTAILIKNSFARIVSSLPPGAVLSSSINSETPTEGEEAVISGPPPHLSLILELRNSSASNGVAIRRSLEQAVAMDVLAYQADMEGNFKLASEYRALADADITTINCDFTPFIRSRTL